MSTTKQSPRKELDEYANSGNLRRDVHGRISEEAEDLLIDVVRRYCEPRRNRRRPSPLSRVLA